MCPEKSTTLLPTCELKSSKLSGCLSPTRPASLRTATSARCSARHRSIWESSRSTAALGCPSERSSPGFLFVHPCTQASRGSAPLDSRGRLSLRYPWQRAINRLLFLRRQSPHRAFLQIAQNERPD